MHFLSLVYFIFNDYYHCLSDVVTMLLYKMVDNNAWALFIIIIIIIIIVSQHAPNCLRNRYGTFDCVCVWGGGGGGWGGGVTTSSTVIMTVPVWPRARLALSNIKYQRESELAPIPLINKPFPILPHKSTNAIILHLWTWKHMENKQCIKWAASTNEIVLTVLCSWNQ